MPLKEKIALGFLVGLVFFFLMILSFNLGVNNSKEEEKQLQSTSDNYKNAMCRYRGLFIQQKRDTQAWKDNCHSVSNIDKVFNIKVVK